MLIVKFAQSKYVAQPKKKITQEMSTLYSTYIALETYRTPGVMYINTLYIYIYKDANLNVLRRGEQPFRVVWPRCFHAAFHASNSVPGQIIG